MIKRLKVKTRWIYRRKKVFIFTEGVTEKLYFENLKAHYKLNAEITCMRIGKLKLLQKVVKIKEAKEQVEDLLKRDEVWVVLDRDRENAYRRDEQNFMKIYKLANNNNIQLAYSDDCFELWFLLHYQDVSSPLTRKDILSKLKQQCRKQGFKYTKTTNIFPYIYPNTDLAIKRAQQLEKSKDESHNDMTTTVHKLVNEFMKSDKIIDD